VAVRRSGCRPADRLARVPGEPGPSRPSPSGASGSGPSRWGTRSEAPLCTGRCEAIATRFTASRAAVMARSRRHHVPFDVPTGPLRGLDWACLTADRLRLDRLPATAVRDFLPLRAARSFLAKQQSRRRPPFIALRPLRGAVRSSPVLPTAIEAAKGGPKKRKELHHGDHWLLHRDRQRLRLRARKCPLAGRL